MLASPWLKIIKWWWTKTLLKSISLKIFLLLTILSWPRSFFRSIEKLLDSRIWMLSNILSLEMLPFTKMIICTRSILRETANYLTLFSFMATEEPLWLSSECSNIWDLTSKYTLLILLELVFLREESGITKWQENKLQSIS